MGGRGKRGALNRRGGVRFYGSLSSGDGNVGWEWSRVQNCWRLSWPKKTKRSDVHMLGCRKKEVIGCAEKDANARKKVLKSIVVTHVREFRRKYTRRTPFLEMVSLIDFLREND